MTCLDLFAGSGALGFEALSRGARQVLFVDKSRAVAAQLKKNLELLGLESKASVRQLDGLRLLAGRPAQRFDLVFLDPPFAQDLLEKSCQALEQGQWLAEQAWIYLEQDSSRPWFDLPSNWHFHREARAGQATGRLVRRAKIGT